MRSPAGFALLTGLVWLALYNRRFWADALSVIEPRSWGDALFVASMFVLLWLAYAGALLLAPGNRALKALAGAGFLLAAVAAYFADAYGIAIDRDTVRNVLETDAREVWGLVNLRFAAHVLVLGVLPAALVWRVRLAELGLQRQVLQRAALWAGAPLFALAAFTAFNAHYVSFLREHKSVRLLVVPANAVYGTASYLSHAWRAANQAPGEDPDAPVTRAPVPAGKPLLVFVVVGETARADNFQLGGYGRETNPELARRGVLYFSNVTACGTSTAISLPCMFSGAGRDRFDAARAGSQANLLDAVARAGIDVEWRDNNSGCKGICARVRTIEHARATDERYCGKRGCYDEIMLEGLPEAISRLKSDALIVFHQAGSHGPGYHERYPPRFEKFTPVCRGNDLSRCSADEVRNAYDNSIVYSDHVVAKQIDLLAQVARTVDSALIYVSDHGESLGELGLYLHGAPFGLAPQQQKRVPLLLWMSEGYAARSSLSRPCLEAKTRQALSHDNLYHTVLGALGVSTARYNPSMDLFAGCRAERPIDASISVLFSVQNGPEQQADFTLGDASAKGHKH